MGWGHVWEHVNDETWATPQTRTLTYLASGGFFGVGLGNSYLAPVFAADSDLVFGLLCEEQGLLLGLVVLFAFVLFVFYARSDVTRSRSTFFSIAACSAAGMLLFQAALNVFGATDVLPMTGVTLPFISAGGSSLHGRVGAAWPSSRPADERTYAARRACRHKRAPRGASRPCPEKPRAPAAAPARGAADPAKPGNGGAKGRQHLRPLAAAIPERRRSPCAPPDSAPWCSTCCWRASPGGVVYLGVKRLSSTGPSGPCSPITGTSTPSTPR